MTRATSIILAGLLAAAAIASGISAARRVGGFHRDHPREQFAFSRVDARDFSYAGRPVTLRDHESPSGRRLVVTYAEHTLSLPVVIPKDPRLPGLIPHEDWMGVLRFASATSMDLPQLVNKMNAGEVRDRLVIVTRTPELGADPSTWGGVNKRRWTFDFYEFLPEGGFAHQKMAFPSKRTRERAEREGRELAIPQLQEKTWEFEAALMVMPKGGEPNPEFRNDGLASMGWTLPAAGFATIGMIAMLVVAASRKSPVP
ncbi:MAG: hypothetical protein JNL50_11765, partial [Phycisphaerae bacterium]|nr:hypothetical protein [Phycisphaerae bacterium]